MGNEIDTSLAATIDDYGDAENRGIKQFSDETQTRLKKNEPVLIQAQSHQN